MIAAENNKKIKELKENYKMNKTELIAKVQENIDIEVSKKDLTTILDGIIETSKANVASGEKIALVGFGTFEAVERAARECKNPRTGEPVHVEASKAPKFKAGKAFKDAVNA